MNLSRMETSGLKERFIDTKNPPGGEGEKGEEERT